MYQKFGRNFLFLLLHCGHRRCWSQQTWWGIHYLKLCITRNARAALTPFLSTYVVLYITTMVTGTINFSAYIPSTSYKISITTPKACQFNVWWKDVFFFLLWTYWVLYYDSSTFLRTETDRNSSLCMKWTKVAVLIWLFSYRTKKFPISACAEMGNFFFVVLNGIFFLFFCFFVFVTCL